MKGAAIMKIGTHKERVQRVRAFTEKNKLFTVIAMAIVVFLITNFLFSKGKDKQYDETSSQAETSQTDNVEGEPLEFRFYWSDLVILVSVGGFCLIKIIQEKKKVREKI